jgi:hypothetical protein
MPNKRNRKAFLTTAYHEAGHALADDRLGFKIKKVTIIPASGSLGVASSRLGVKPKVLEYGNPTSATVARWHDKVVTLLAGQEAQRKFCSQSIRSHHGKPDREAVLDILERLHGGGEELQAACRYLEIRARNLVCRPLHWQMIADLAELLLKRGTLTGDEVVGEFRASFQRQMARPTETRAPSATRTNL